jgi:ArsR family transcriptional regulator
LTIVDALIIIDASKNVNGMRVLNLLGLASDGEVCICSSSRSAKSQPTISHHLKLLVDAGLVHGERRGKWVWYSLDRDRLAALRTAIDG